MGHFSSVMVVPAFLDLFNPVKPHTFTFAHNFSLKGKNKSKTLAAVADGWLEGEQWQMALVFGKAFISHIWWCCWVLSRTAGSFKGAPGTDGQWLPNEMGWQRGRQSFKGFCPGHGEMRLQMRHCRGPSTLTSWDNYWEKSRSFPLCSKFCFCIQNDPDSET